MAIKLFGAAKDAAIGPNPYVFVVGCPRSGTTLLGRLLDSHSMLALADEAHFIPYPVRKLQRRIDPALTPALVKHARDYHRFQRLGLSDDLVEAAADGARTYAGFVRAIFDQYAGLGDKPLAEEKAPYYVRYMPLLHTLLPSTRFVHIIRDGREVALSLVH